MITLTIFIAMSTGVLGFLLGAHLSYQRGYTDAWYEAELFYDDENGDLADIRWSVTPSSLKLETSNLKL